MPLGRRGGVSAAMEAYGVPGGSRNDKRNLFFGNDVQRAPNEALRARILGFRTPVPVASVQIHALEDPSLETPH
jgi:hypothetical protein